MHDPAYIHILNNRPFKELASTREKKYSNFQAIAKFTAGEPPRLCNEKASREWVCDAPPGGKIVGDFTWRFLETYSSSYLRYMPVVRLPGWCAIISINWSSDHTYNSWSFSQLCCVPLPMNVASPACDFHNTDEMKSNVVLACFLQVRNPWAHPDHWSPRRDRRWNSRLGPLLRDRCEREGADYWKLREKKREEKWKSRGGETLENRQCQRVGLFFTL